MATCAACRKSASRMARGMCHSCYMKAHRAGTLNEYDRATWKSSELVGEFEHVRDPGLPKHQQIRVAAQRIGVSYAALESALRRREAVR